MVSPDLYCPTCDEFYFCYDEHQDCRNTSHLRDPIQFKYRDVEFFSKIKGRWCIESLESDWPELVLDAGGAQLSFYAAFDEAIHLHRKYGDRCHVVVRLCTRADQEVPGVHKD